MTKEERSEKIFLKFVDKLIEDDVVSYNKGENPADLQSIKLIKFWTNILREYDNPIRGERIVPRWGYSETIPGFSPYKGAYPLEDLVDDVKEFAKENGLGKFDDSFFWSFDSDDHNYTSFREKGLGFVEDIHAKVLSKIIENDTLRYTLCDVFSCRTFEIYTGFSSGISYARSTDIIDCEHYQSTKSSGMMKDLFEKRASEKVEDCFEKYEEVLKNLFRKYKTPNMEDFPSLEDDENGTWLLNEYDVFHEIATELLGEDYFGSSLGHEYTDFDPYNNPNGSYISYNECWNRVFGMVEAARTECKAEGVFDEYYAESDEKIKLAEQEEKKKEAAEECIAKFAKEEILKSCEWSLKLAHIDESYIKKSIETRIQKERPYTHAYLKEHGDVLKGYSLADICKEAVVETMKTVTLFGNAGKVRFAPKVIAEEVKLDDDESDPVDNTEPHAEPHIVKARIVYDEDIPY